MCSGLVKTTDLVGANFYGHSRDNTELGMEGWAEIDHVVV